MITFDCRRRAFDINCVASDEDEDGSLFEVSGFLIFCSEFGRISGILVELSFELSCHQRLGRKACKAHILLWRHREVLWPSFAFSCGVCLKMNPASSKKIQNVILCPIRFICTSYKRHQSVPKDSCTQASQGIGKDCSFIIDHSHLPLLDLQWTLYSVNSRRTVISTAGESTEGLPVTSKVKHI